MLITKDILADYGAAKTKNLVEELKKFEKTYPNGIEFIDLLKEKEKFTVLLSWCYLFLPLNEKEKVTYDEEFEIKNSFSVYKSFYITNSKFITHSKNIFDSSYVHGSDNVELSSVIRNSSSIDHSEEIFSSEKVSNSFLVVNSSNITNSKNIVNSTKIRESKNIFKSMDVNNSDIIYNSEQVRYSVFCNNCTNCEGVLFSSDLSNKNFFCFNRPIKFSMYNEIIAQYKKLFPELTIDLVNSTSSGFLECNIPISPSQIMNLGKHFAKIDKRFWEWVSTLPNFNIDILYQLTYLPSVYNLRFS